ncbi:MAG: hypothetical protein IJ727_06415 [Treponema sp.]|nr:hypothetical protein [Treponema sp.]
MTASNARNITAGQAHGVGCAFFYLAVSKFKFEERTASVLPTVTTQ